MLSKKIFGVVDNWLDVALILLAMTVTWTVICLEQGRINDDAVLYLEVAKYFSHHEWAAGLNLYPWPFYSALVAVLSMLTSLTLETSAHLLSIVFFALTTYAFIRLIRLAGGTDTTVIAGAILLFSNTYIIGDTLPLILRDQGFWAFILISSGYFLQFYRDNTQRHALAWQITCIIATLFRTEGLTFLALMPLAIMLQPQRTLTQRFYQLLSAYSLSLIGIVVIAGILLTMTSLENSNIKQIQIIFSYIHHVYIQISQGLTDKAHTIGKQVLGEFLSDYGMQGLLLTMLAVIFGKVTGTAGWISFLLSAFQSKLKNVQISAEARTVLIWAGVISIVNMLISLLANFILAGRYAIPVAFIVMTFASFSLAALYEKAKISKDNKKATWILALIAILACLNLAHIFQPKRHGYAYEKEAVTWVQAYAKSDQKIFYDNARLRYYADLPLGQRGVAYWDMVERAINDGSLTQHDFLVIHIPKEKPEQQAYLLNHFDYKIIKEFTSKNKPKIIILSKIK
ncbi:hypothetical protein A7981_03290 [Methylovorus sp. MM2]|uniref:hypothetical protein n=1 Tax=Methylovorus sp. MM2 TaxID=1848038 RepID=UPI0007E14D82|nr:hypothetical protein [Methylovorus sp. MM2]OAM52509.1 hypothetical protein A7981_03290 [Methylovorus sp. MM2]